MQHRLNITVDRNAIREVQAETNLGPSPQLSTPQFVFGKFLSLNAEEIAELWTNRAKVEVGFEGHPYRLEALDKDGEFRLCLAAV